MLTHFVHNFIYRMIELLNMLTLTLSIRIINDLLENRDNKHKTNLFSELNCNGTEWLNYSKDRITQRCGWAGEA